MLTWLVNWKGHHFGGRAKMNSDLFSPDMRLPEELSYKSAANRLYKLGLTLRHGYKWRRSLLHKPIVITIVLSLYIIKTFVNLLSDNRQVFMYLGKFSHFMGLAYHFDCVTIIFFSNVIISQIVYLVNYHRGKLLYFN